MYGFLLNMWIMRRITEEKLQTYVPRFINQAEFEMIIATPQADLSQISIIKEVTE